MVVVIFWISLRTLLFPISRYYSPLMIQTQKLSSLAFNINDGFNIENGIVVEHEYHKVIAVKRRPRLLELAGYLFCFHNAMVGPFSYFADYMRFIDGDEVSRLSDEKQKEYLDEVRRQLKYLAFHLPLTFLALTYFKVTWLLTCICNLTSGFGFSGFTNNLEPDYSLATNIYFTKIEFGTSMKSIVDAWNTATASWLRQCVYDRVPKRFDRRFAVWSAFLASAIWHGFYPCFYLCFLSAAVYTVIGRMCRRQIRPLFLSSPLRHRLYDVATHLSALAGLNYLGIAFSLKYYDHVLFFWRQMLFLGHIIPLVLLTLLLLANKSSNRSEQDFSNESNVVGKMSSSRITENHHS